ncbi:MAG: cupredoxin domain-containing protein [Terriglobia bacterium]
MIQFYHLGGYMRGLQSFLLFTLFFVSGIVSVEAIAKDKPSAPANVVKVGNPAPTDATIKEVDVSAKKYEFNPASIEVPLNTLLKIHLNAIDHEHGFEIKGIKDSCVKYKPNEPVTVEFYADKAGEFEFHCCKFCGFGHANMKGKLVVK